MDHKTPPPPPTEPKKALTQETLSKINPIIFAPAAKKKTRIYPRDLLKNPRAAFVFAEIMRPID